MNPVEGSGRSPEAASNYRMVASSSLFWAKRIKGSKEGGVGDPSSKRPVSQEAHGPGGTVTRGAEREVLVGPGDSREEREAGPSAQRLCLRLGSLAGLFSTGRRVSGRTRQPSASNSCLLSRPPERPRAAPAAGAGKGTGFGNGSSMSVPA